VDNIDETSPEFEPLSVLDNENSNDESISGMSDLVSVGSPIQLVPKENHDNTSNGFENDKNILEKPQHIDKNGIINHKNTKPDNIKISTNIEKLKTNDTKPKSKNSFSSKHSSNQEKSSTHKSKNRNSNSHRSTSQEKNDIKKSNSNHSKDRKNSNHRHHSDSKDKKHRHDKKSNLSERDKTPKRDRKNSRSDKKEKSSSLCKEPKSLNGNRSDDESNAGGSSKQKSNVHKNKSSTSDKSKSSSSHHKSSRKDNGSKDVVDKSKDKSSISKTSYNSSHKINRTHSKKRKHSLNNDDKLSESNPSIQEKKPKWSDFMTNDEQDAANVLLSMSEISYENSHSEVITENILFIGNPSFTDNTLKTTSNTSENILENQENLIQTNNVEFSDNNDIEENFHSQSSDIKTPQSLQSIDNVNEKCVLPINQSISEKEYSADAESCTLLSCKDDAPQKTSFENIKITSEPNEQIKLEVPKLKLKLLPNQINLLNHEKRKKHHKNHKSKVKKLKQDSSNEVGISIIDTAPTTINCKQNTLEPICDIDLKLNDNVISAPNQGTFSLPKENEINNAQPLENNESLNTFKGFTQSDAVPCKNYEQLKHLVIALKKSLSNENIKSIIDTDGFKGFTDEELRPCKNRDLVNLQIIKLKEEIGFPGFSEEEILMSSGHQFIKQQLELSKKQNYINGEESSMTCGGNEIKNQRTFKEVMSIIYESNNDGNSTTKKIYTKPVTIEKKKCSVVNNNNHDITASNDWVVKQEMKYKLLPVKVKLERLMEYRYNGEDILLNIIFFD
jgi:hypothetical protein